MFSLLAWPDENRVFAEAQASGTIVPPKSPPKPKPKPKPAAASVHYRMTNCREDREDPPVPEVPAATWTSTYDADFQEFSLKDCPCAGVASRNRGRSGPIDAEDVPETKEVWVTEYQRAFQDTTFLFPQEAPAPAPAPAEAMETKQQEGEWVVVDEFDEAEKKEAEEEMARFEAALEGAGKQAAQKDDKPKGKKPKKPKKAPVVPRAAQVSKKYKPVARVETKDNIDRETTDTQTARVHHKPIFHVYGREATEPEVGGVLYGNYMRSFHKNKPWPESSQA